MNGSISFRNATVDDALFLARGFHMAMLYDGASEEQISNFAQNICVREDVLYSWRNSIIAEIDGKCAGMLTAYDGRYYHDMRVRTMSYVKQALGIEFPGMEDEAVAGEYYLDSLAVMPEYRGRGIGRELLLHGIANGKALCLDVTLAVDPVNERAKKLYDSLGFKPSGTLFIFGHDYEKMVITAINNTTMKVLLINGSPRQKGNTYTTLNEIAQQLEKQGVASEIVWIGNKAVRGCIACGQCKANADCRCVFGDQDITNEVIAKMAECDAIILGSPVYWGQPSGQLLCLQQRMLYAGGANFQGKPAAAVTVCRRGGASAAFQALQMPFQMCNMPLIGSQYWNIAYGREEGQSAQDVEGMQTMRTLANNMAWTLKKMHGIETTEAPEREPWTPMHFIR